MAVSYTHLDVYKRQAYASNLPDESYADVEGSYASNEIAINWSAALVALVSSLDALTVSYTHLDVYKRQVGHYVRSDNPFDGPFGDTRFYVAAQYEPAVIVVHTPCLLYTSFGRTWMYGAQRGKDNKFNSK